MNKIIPSLDSEPPAPGLSPLAHRNRQAAEAQPAPDHLSQPQHCEPAASDLLVSETGALYSVSERSDEFRRLYFPEASLQDWNSWRWQLHSRIRNLAQLERIFILSRSERATIERIGGRLPLGITPYYASLMDAQNAKDPIRRTMIPVRGELLRTPGEADDPLGEETDAVVPGLIHRYPDRVLFLVTNFCATYCRYCTRARMVGHSTEFHASYAQYELAINYIAEHPEIRDVLISGGDPLTMTDERLDWLLSRLRAIKHVEFLRIGTKIPLVLPQRITPELVAMLKRHHPFWLSVHTMHPVEFTPEVVQACERLADAGIPVGSQTVLTRGVNDDVETMRALKHAELRARVRPYYIYQCDPISGSSHLRTPIEKGLEILDGLRGHTTGYAVPTYVVDAPGGGGKIPLLSQSVVGRDGNDVLLRNFEGNIYRYPDPVTGSTRGGRGRKEKAS